MSLRLTSGALAFLLLCSACATSSSRPSETANAVSVERPEPPQRPDQAPADAPVGAPEALAWTTAAYAEAVETSLGRRPAALPQTGPALSEAASPALVELPPVQWLDPSEFRLTLGPPQADWPSRSPAGENSTAEPLASPETAEASGLPDHGEPAFAPLYSSDAEIDIAQAQEAASELAIAIAPPTLPLLPAGEGLEDKLTAQVEQAPRDLAAHLDYQLMQFLRGEPVPQLEAITTLPAEDREILSAVMDALANFRAVVRADVNGLLHRKARPLLDLAERLRPQTNLRIPAISLCSKVDGFGVYEPIDAERLPTGRAHTMIIYSELENFSSRLNDRQLWETNLTQEAILYSERGSPVWEAPHHPRRPITDISRSRRRDFFLARMITLPAKLPPGRYTLTITITDQQANRMAETSLPVQLVELNVQN